MTNISNHTHIDSPCPFELQNHERDASTHRQPTTHRSVRGKVSETAKGDELAAVSNWISPSNQSDFTIQPRSRQISPKKGRVGSHARSHSNGWVCPLIRWYPSLMWHMRIRDLTAVHCFAVLQYHADPHLQPVDVRQETLQPMQ